MYVDEYLGKACEEADVFELRWIEHQKPLDRLMARIEAGFNGALRRITNWRAEL